MAVLPLLPAAESPNIVLIMCDDLGWGDVGFNGNTVIRTPHLDEMAQAGLKFNRFYAQAPVCSPTRGSCLTGRHPYRYGVYFANDGHLKPDELTLAELLRDHGYATGHFGKWHLGTLTTTIQDANRGGPRGAEHFSPPQANGFDVCFCTESKVPTWDPMWKPAHAGRLGWEAIQDRSQAVRYGTRYWDEQGREVTDNLEGDDSRVIMDRVLPFIGEATTANQPFFAVVWFHTPHLPVVAGPQYVKMYQQHSAELDRNYYGCITAMDEQVGRLRTFLREVGAAGDTMVWFCSDNGPEGDAGAPGSAGPFRGRKRSLYEGGVRVPGLLEWPGHAEPDSTTDLPVVTSDFLPTVLDVLNVQLADSRPIDGVSLLPLLAGTMSQRPQPIGFQSRGQVALSDNRYKLVGNVEGTRWELYDLRNDPGEQHDCAGTEPQTLQTMIRKLQEWQASCAASDAGADYQ